MSEQVPALLQLELVVGLDTRFRLYLPLSRKLDCGNVEPRYLVDVVVVSITNLFSSNIRYTFKWQILVCIRNYC